MEAAGVALVNQISRSYPAAPAPAAAYGGPVPGAAPQAGQADPQYVRDQVREILADLLVPQAAARRPVVGHERPAGVPARTPRAPEP
jgi:hypothetical protein